MPTRVLLEGPAIEPLLAQVREEYGSGVRIISADKVRSGGFGGFFAKQHYELSVEVPDETDDRNDMPRNRMAVEAAPPTLEQLLERAEARDDISTAADDTEVIARSEGREAGINDAEAAAGALPPRAGLVAPNNAFAELMAGLDNANAIAAASAPLRKPSPRPEPATDADSDSDDPDTTVVRPFRPSSATGAPVNGSSIKPLPPVPSLAELMGGLSLDSLDKMNGLAVPPDLTGPARSAAAVYGVRMPALAPPPGAQPAGGAPPVTPPPVASPSVARPPVSQPGQPAVDAAYPPAAQSIDAAAAAAAPAAAESAPAAPTAAAIQVAPTETPPAAEPGQRAAPTDAEPRTAAVADRPASPADPVVANLIRVGMPPNLAATISGGDTYAGVLRTLAARPAAPAIPDGPGDILVLVGELPHALAAARQCLEQIGLDHGHLLLAGPSAAGTGIHSSKVIPGPEDAARRTEKLHTADAAWVVALDAPLGATDSAWVRQTCEALGATAVWAVVDATRKTADTARHLKLLGEIEAVVVHGVENTSDPATVLGLDHPIVSLDGRPATPHAWAAMLCARIASDVTPVAPLTRRPTRGR